MVGPPYCRPSHPPPLPPLFTLFVRHSLRNVVEDERSERMTYGEGKKSVEVRILFPHPYRKRSEETRKERRRKTYGNNILTPCLSVFSHSLRSFLTTWRDTK